LRRIAQKMQTQKNLMVKAKEQFILSEKRLPVGGAFMPNV